VSWSSAFLTRMSILGRHNPSTAAGAGQSLLPMPSVCSSEKERSYGWAVKIDECSLGIMLCIQTLKHSFSKGEHCANGREH
jgi:hypothetical protein